MSAKYGKTKNGVRKYLKTGVYFTNKRYKGKLHQVCTDQTSPLKAARRLDKFLECVDKGLNPATIRLEDVQPAGAPAASQAAQTAGPSSQQPPPAPVPQAAPSGSSFTFEDAMQRLAKRINAKKKEGRITSERSSDYPLRGRSLRRQVELVN